MTIISTVEVDAPAHGPFLARWQQPYLPGDDGLDWYVTTGGTPRRVQRERFTDEIYHCQVLVAAATSTFTLEDGATTSPADAWSAPTLTGLLLRWTGQDGSIAEADLTDATVEEVLRTGTWCHQLKRWTHSKITDVGGGDQALGTEVLGHHTFLSYRADRADVVELEVVISNASTSVGTQGQGIEQFFGHVGFTDVVLVLPVGWSAVAERPLASGGGHMFPTKMLTVRRWVLYQTASSGAVQAATDILAMRGFGRARTGRSFHTVRSYCESKSLLPDLDLGYTYNAIAGYAGARQRGSDLYTTLINAVTAGTTASGSPINLITPRLGLFHPVGGKDPQEPGGIDIATHAGMEQVREYVRYIRLRSDLKMDGSGCFLFDRATGRALRTSDFGDAYTTPGALVGGLMPNPEYVGSQPFPYYTNTNSGYEYATTRTRHFFGWFPPAWPPHFLDNRGSKPDSSFNPTKDLFVPVAEIHWGDPPHSLNTFACSYRAELVTELLLDPVYGTEDPPFYQSPSGVLGHRDREDSAHSVRMFRELRARAFLAGDLVAVFLIDGLAEHFALEYSEVGHVPIFYPDSGQQIDLNAAPNTYSLKRRLEIQASSPGIAKYGTFRWDAWVGDLFALQFAVSSPAKRDAGYPTKGIRKRTEMMFDYLRLGVIELNGGTYHVGNGIGGGLQEMFSGTPSYGGTPINPRYRGMQIGLELPLVHFAMFALGVQLRRQDHHNLVIAGARSHVGLWQKYTHYFSNPAEFGPIKYCAIWDTLTNSPVDPNVAERYGTGSGNPGHPNHEVMLELAYRIDGDPRWLALSNRLGFQVNPLTLPSERAVQLFSYADEWKFNIGLIALLITQPGPDVVVAPPVDTLLSAAITMQVTLGASLTLEPAPPIDPPVDPPVDPAPVVPPVEGAPVVASSQLVFESTGVPDGNQVLLTWSANGGEFRVVGGDLQRDSGLATAVVISLFSDARLDSDPTKPITLQDLRGWWGEAAGETFGSRLWLVEREKASEETRRRAIAYAQEALRWMVDQRIARSVTVSARYLNRTTLVLSIAIARGDARRWAVLWRGALDVRIKAGDLVLQLSGS